MGTQGFLNVGGIDNTVGVHSISIGLDNPTNLSGGLTYVPTTDVFDSITVFNQSRTEILRVLLAFLSQTGTPDNRSFMVPPNGAYTVSFDGPTIELAQFIYVAPVGVAVIHTDYDLSVATLVGLHNAIATFAQG